MATTINLLRNDLPRQGPRPAAPSEPLLDRVEALVEAYDLRAKGPSHWTSAASADWKDRAAIVLREAAAALRESEARCRQLQEENQRLSGLLGGNGPSNSGEGAPRRG